jgi:chemotaxis protein histidine kinase CheA
MAIGRLSVGTGAKGKASAHAQYIAREGKYAKDPEIEKLEHTESGNMPKWAESDPNFFWKMADEHERKNGSTYREHVITLPRELNESQRLALIHDWIDQEIGDKFAYQFAIHTPKAMDGLEQPHCHLMFSERTIDGIERDPAQYFKRYNSKNPDRGGAKKANTGIAPADRKAELSEQRDRWEHICNKHLELANTKARISMKSLKDRGYKRQPVNLTMIQIQKPEIRSVYLADLEAKRSYTAVAKERNQIDIPTELEMQGRQKRLADITKMREAAQQKTAQAEQERKEVLAAQQKATQAEQERKEVLAAQQKATQAEQERKEVLAAQQKATQAEQERKEVLAAQQKATQAEQERKEVLAAQQKATQAENLKSTRSRTPFDLLGIQMRSTVRQSEFGRVEDSLSGNIAIGAIIGRIITAANNGYKVDLREGNNDRLAGNHTAQGIKNFILENLGSSDVRYDYGSLSIEKFTDKYELRCDLSDLKKLNEINPPAPVIDQKLTNHQPSAAKIEPQSTNNYDFDL